MGRRVKDFIEISEYTSLDQLINTLTAIRDNLPEDSEPELRMKGDDVFGRPVDLLMLDDGSMLVSDDKAGAVYRIRYVVPRS